MMVFGLAAALYFGGGTAYRQRMGGAKGWDVLPHAELWWELRALVSDGVAFSQARASGSGGGGGGGGLRKLPDAGSAAKKERLLESELDSPNKEKREKREKKQKKEEPRQPDDMTPAALGGPKTTSSGGGGKWVHVPT